MNELDKTTEDWLEKVARASSQHEGRKLALAVIIVLSLIAAMSYVLFRVFTAEETIGNTYNPIFTETPVAISLAYFCTVLAAGIIYLSVKEYRSIYRKNYANETMAEGVVYSSVVVHCTNVEIGDHHTDIMEIRKIRVAVRSLDKFLYARVKVILMKNGVYLQVPKWEKGDKVIVMYDPLKPRVCRIADTKKYIGAEQANRRMR